MSYVVMETGSGFICSSWTTQEEARAWIAANKEPDEELVLLRFGRIPSDNELIERFPENQGGPVNDPLPPALETLPAA